MDKSTQISTRFFGVSGCYIYKSQLREYVQKVGMENPVYETINDGPSHDPCFRSTVIVDNARYDSLAGFSKRKASEQSAAEVALIDLAKSGNTNEKIAFLLQESGLCKQLLQQYAHKMKYTLPVYVCRYDNREGKLPFTCTVEIGNTLYAGASAKSYKAARIDAARTALLAVQSNEAGNLTENSQYVVLPIRKKKVVSTRKKTTFFNLKQNCVWRKKVDRKFPSDMFDKLKTFVSEQGVVGATSTFDGGSNLKDDERLVVPRIGTNGMNPNGVVEDLKVHSLQADSEIICLEPKTTTKLWRQVENKLPGDMFDKLGSVVAKQGVPQVKVTCTDDVRAKYVGKLATEVNPNFSILSRFDMKDLMALAEEIHKYCGSEVVAPTP
ncbi:hypothetical protein ACHQM5_023666 [Ranunculus cassubicifolius]